MAMVDEANCSVQYGISGLPAGAPAKDTGVRAGHAYQDHYRTGQRPTETNRESAQQQYSIFDAGRRIHHHGQERREPHQSSCQVHQKNAQNIFDLDVPQELVGTEVRTLRLG
jgi:hypothetical protein